MTGGVGSLPACAARAYPGANSNTTIPACNARFTDCSLSRIPVVGQVGSVVVQASRLHDAAETAAPQTDPLPNSNDSIVLTLSNVRRLLFDSFFSRNGSIGLFQVVTLSAPVNSGRNLAHVRNNR